MYVASEHPIAKISGIKSFVGARAECISSALKICISQEQVSEGKISARLASFPSVSSLLSAFAHLPLLSPAFSVFPNFYDTPHLFLNLRTPFSSTYFSTFAHRLQEPWVRLHYTTGIPPLDFYSYLSLLYLLVLCSK